LLVPQPAVDYNTFGGISRIASGGWFGLHMPPRNDVIILGGTSERKVL
jgi:hypothetical protein